MRLGDLLDVHAAGRAGNHDGTRGCAIDDDAEIQLTLDLQPLFDKDAAHRPAFRTGLMGHERHPDHLFRDLLGFFWRFRQLDAAALTATARMNLGLDDHNVAAEPARDVADVVGRERHLAARHGHTEAGED